MATLSYLNRYPVFDARDRALAQAQLFSRFGADRFDAVKSGFRARSNYADLPNVGIAFCSYDSAASVSFPESGLVRQFFTVQGAGRLASGRLERSFGLCSPTVQSNARLDLQFSPAYRQIVLRIEKDSLTRLLESMLGETLGPPLTFAEDDPHPILISSLRRDVFNLAEDLESDLFSPTAIAELERSILSKFLSCNSHSYSARLHRSPPSANRSVIDIVESYIQENWQDALDFNALARLANVSVRTIFREFAQSGRGSPSKFARRVRLHRAAELLKCPDEMTTVTAIAYRCGFRSTGHFSIEYRQLHGESPSETLKKGLARL